MNVEFVNEDYENVQTTTKFVDEGNQKQLLMRKRPQQNLWNLPFMSWSSTKSSFKRCLRIRTEQLHTLKEMIIFKQQ